MNIAKDISGKKKLSKEKIRGGYYTPLPLAEYLCNWALRSEGLKILEPSVGDGSFLEAINTNQFSKNSKTTAIEIEKKELEKAKRRASKFDETKNLEFTWMEGDFFLNFDSLRNDFDVVLGNPPFIRFQYFDSVSRDTAFSLLRKFDYKPSGLSNAWAAFIELSVELLRIGGRMAMVVPAELLQVGYAAELRSRLTRQFDSIVLIGFKKLVFPEIQQEVLLLLADGKHEIRNNHSEIHTIEFLDGNELLESNNLSNAIAHSSTKHSENGMKWTALFLDDTNYRAIEKTKRIEKLHKLGDFAEVDVGIVTGRNKYFILSKNEVKGRRISKYFKSIIGKTSELRSLYFTKDDLKKYREQFPSYLLYLNKFEMDSSIPEEISNYLTLGEDMGVNDGYKCRIRKVWFHIPSVYTPDAFLYRQIHKFPLVVINQARTTSTDTIHRIRFSKDVNPGLFAFCFFNSLTLAWSEVLGRSYGGGVLELEPSEAEALPIPYSNDIKADIDKTDRLLREGKYTQALDYADEILLKEYLSISSKEIQDIRAAWIELRNRRTFRRK